MFKDDLHICTRIKMHFVARDFELSYFSCIRHILNFEFSLDLEISRGVARFFFFYWNELHGLLKYIFGTDIKEEFAPSLSHVSHRKFRTICITNSANSIYKWSNYWKTRKRRTCKVVNEINLRMYNITFKKTLSIYLCMK